MEELGHQRHLHLVDDWRILSDHLWWSPGSHADNFSGASQGENILERKNS